VAGADGEQNVEAALGLLFRDPTQIIFRADIVDLFVAGIHPAYVNWRGLWRATRNGEISLGLDERAVIMLACSMALVDCHVRWSDHYLDLDLPTRRAWVDAMAHLVGAP